MLILPRFSFFYLTPSIVLPSYAIKCDIKQSKNQDSKAAIKIYEMCCPFSNERICAIKAKPPVVVNTLKLIRNILDENPIKGTTKPYDALHFDPNLVEKYGGYLPEEGMPLATFGPIDAYDAHRQASLIFANRSALYHPVMPPSEYRYQNRSYSLDRIFANSCKCKSIRTLLGLASATQV